MQSSTTMKRRWLCHWTEEESLRSGEVTNPDMDHSFVDGAHNRSLSDLSASAAPAHMMWSTNDLGRNLGTGPCSRRRTSVAGRGALSERAPTYRQQPTRTKTMSRQMNTMVLRMTTRTWNRQKKTLGELQGVRQTRKWRKRWGVYSRMRRKGLHQGHRWQRRAGSTVRGSDRSR